MATVAIRGVEVRQRKNGKSIYVSFMFEGDQRRELLRGYDGDKKTDIKNANSIKGQIDREIVQGTFNYGGHFPQSTHLKKLALKGEITTQVEGDSSNEWDKLNFEALSIGFYICEYLDHCTTRGLSPSTLNGYKKSARQLTSLYKILVTEFKQKVLKQLVISKADLSIKTIRNALSVLSCALNEAVVDDVIELNPCNGFKPSQYLKKSDKVDLEGKHEDVDPFTPKEISAILASCNDPQVRNLFQFAFGTGLRSSELAAIKWRDIDFIGQHAVVREARVEKTTKGPKTKKGHRAVELDTDSLAALKSQKDFTFLIGEYVFHNPRTNQHWEGAAPIRKRAWMPALQKSGVRYRYPYQTRHTFATKHISQRKNLFWLAEQMGHNGPQMLFNHYGSYIKEHDKLAGQYTPATAQK